MAAEQDTQAEEEEGAVGGDLLEVGANQELEEDDDDDDGEDDEDDDEYENEYDAEEEEYLNKFINKDSVVSNRVTTKRVSLFNWVGICFDHIFFPEALQDRQTSEKYCWEEELCRDG